MKVLLVGMAKLKYMPYINFYIDNLRKKQNDISIVYWNRDLEDEDLSMFSDIALYEYRDKMADQIGKIRKLKHLWGFKSFVEKIIEENSYEYIITMQSLTAVLLKNVLINEYKGRYIFDYRDSSYEAFNWYKRQIQLIQSKAKYTFVSSDGFRQYFSENEQSKIFTSHNILEDSLKHREDREKFGLSSSKIRIGFWGMIRDKEINLSLLSRLGNDDRFELHYYGKEETIAKELKEYAVQHGMDNVYFHGSYLPEDRYEFVKKTDVIHNLYNNNNNMRIAMGNKFYDGIIFRIPQVVNAGGHIMGMKATNFGIGIELSPDEETFGDQLYQFYMNLSWNEFYSNCDKALEIVLNEYKKDCAIIASLS